MHIADTRSDSINYFEPMVITRSLPAKKSSAVVVTINYHMEN